MFAIRAPLAERHSACPRPSSSKSVLFLLSSIPSSSAVSNPLLIGGDGACSLVDGEVMVVRVKAWTTHARDDNDVPSSPPKRSLSSFARIRRGQALLYLNLMSMGTAFERI